MITEIIIVIVIMGLCASAMSVLTPVIPLYLTSIGISPEILGSMVAMSMVGMLAGEGFWRWAADRIGIKIPLLMGTFICSLAVISFF